MNNRGFLLLFVCLFLIGCHEGYQKEQGEFVWVTYDTGNGRTSFAIDADEATFEALNKDYGKDKYSVFYRRRKIIDADPASFRLMEQPYFSRDDRHVFLMGCTVVGADPETFEILPGLFGRDQNQAYARTVPIKSADPKTFRSEETSFTSHSRCEISNRDDFLQRYGKEYADIEVSKERPAIVATGDARDANNVFLRDSARIDQR